MSIYEYDEEKHMKMEREEHFAMGVAQEQSQLLQLITAMTEDGLQDHIPKLATDPGFLAEMRKKYNL